MKLFPYVAILSVLTIPAYATGTDLSEEKIPVAATDMPTDATTAADTVNVTNPDIKFPHGLQIGLGISATGGMDGFVGYANKKFDSFWLKRLGLRLNFATTAPLKSAIDSGVDAIMGDEGIDLGDGLTIKDGGA